MWLKAIYKGKKAWGIYPGQKCQAFLSHDGTYNLFFDIAKTPNQRNKKTPRLYCVPADQVELIDKPIVSSDIEIKPNLVSKSKRKLTVTLPDGKKITRTTHHDYYGVVAVRHTNGWFYVQWVGKDGTPRTGNNLINQIKNRKAQYPEHYKDWLELKVIPKD